MKDEIQQCNERFLRTIDPFLEMLSNKQMEVNQEEWTSMVRRLESAVVSYVDQYSGNNIPSPDVMVRVISEIFDDFIGHRISKPIDLLTTIISDN